jgi:hypothetical protein
LGPWVALGIFLLGAGAGALTTFALYVKQIRQLKGLLLKTECSNSPTKEQEQRHEPNGRKSA